MLKLVQDTDIQFLNAIKTWARHLRDEEILLLRYEDLLADFESSFSNALDYAGLQVPESDIARMKAEYSFQSMTNRKSGEEDTSHHYRKGVAGDWENYFDEEISAAFNRVYGDVCTALGYALPEARGVDV